VSRDSNKRVLILAAKTGYQTQVFTEAAGRIGFEAVLATDRCHVLEDPWGDNAIPVRFEDPESAATHLAATASPLDGIVAVGDRPTLIAALTAERLALPFHPPDAVIAARNKFAARERFRAASLLIPEYIRLPLDANINASAEKASYPCVLKPLGLSGSRGVIRANDPLEFAAAFRRIRALLDTSEIRRLRDDGDQYIQVERFIPGNEFAVEGMVTQGQLQVLAIFDKPDPLNGPFFEETIYVTPSRQTERVQRLIIETVTRAVAALGLLHGPVHAELRVNGEGAWMLEVAARPIGGLCARSLRFAGGATLEELILRHAVSEDVSGCRRESAASGVMMIPIPKDGLYAGVSGDEVASETPGCPEIVITAKRGQKLLRLPEGNSYLGFIFSRGTTPESVDASLRLAHQRLRFEIQPNLTVMNG